MATKMFREATIKKIKEKVKKMKGPSSKRFQNHIQWYTLIEIKYQILIEQR